MASAPAVSPGRVRYATLYVARCILCARDVTDASGRALRFERDAARAIFRARCPVCRGNLAPERDEEHARIVVSEPTIDWAADAPKRGRPTKIEAERRRREALDWEIEHAIDAIDALPERERVA
jgi:hypothetical protein